MHTFSQIAHKATSETDELYSFSTQANSKNMKSEFHSLAHNYECKPNITIPIENDMTNRLMKILLFMFAVGPINYSIESKFSYFKKTIDNIFMTASQRQEFISRFCIIQRHYWALSRAVYRYKWRKAPCRIQSDLILTPISESQDNVITIFQNNSKYLFTIYDLRTIIEGALSNSPYMFAHPTAPKNPYNNLPFDKATLYHIYFFMKRGNFVLSNLFHNYFLCNFNLLHFKSENEVIIRKKYIGEYLDHADFDELYDESLRMLSMSKFTKKLTIDEDFPKQRLVEIMRPYLRIFFSHIYSLDICERNNSACELSRQLKRFYDYNPQFGRKFIRLKNGRKTKWQYNDKHIEFRGKNYSLNFKNSHLDLVETNMTHARIPSPPQENNDVPEFPGVSDESEDEDEDEDNDDDYNYDDYSIRGPTGQIDTSNFDIVAGTTGPEGLQISILMVPMGESEYQQNSDESEDGELDNAQYEIVRM